MSTENEAWRLFLAAGVPAEVAERLAGAQAKIRRGLGERGAELRWTKPENFHLTLFFLGPVASARVPEISASAAKVAAESAPLTLDVRGLGAFPEDRSARVLWAGLQNSRELRGLRDRVAAAMAALGFPPDPREFHPHLTIARLRSARSLREYVEMFRRQAFGSIEVRELVLFRSHPAVPYPRYEPLARFPCAG
jgi:2'-5' RNA ligase